MAHAVHALDKAGQEAKSGKSKIQAEKLVEENERPSITKTQIRRMKVADLLLLASENKVYIPENATRADMIEAIEDELF